MKKKVAILLAVILIFSLSASASAEPRVKVKVDGEFIDFDIQPIITIGGRTLVPVRYIFEALGLKVEWNGETRTVIGTKEDLIIELPIGDRTAKRNGVEIELDVPATIVNGRTMVPVRFVAESTGAYVAWEADQRTVTISSTQEIKVHFIDVGQAESIFIDCGNYDILIDGGNDVDGSVVVDYLKALNTDDIEILVATSPKEEHIGGLDDVMDAFSVEQIIDNGFHSSSWEYEEYWNSVQDEDAEYFKDQYIRFNIGPGILFEIVEYKDGFISSSNNYSVVSKLTYNDISFLFTGDMDEEGEKNILDKSIEADILKVGNHGSRLSTSQSFLEKVKPEAAVISAGKNNGYGYPHQDTLKRLESHNADVYGTWLSGDIIITTDGTNYRINTDEKISDDGTEPSLIY